MQAIGATTPAITAVMALCILRKRETRQTYLTLIPVVVGIVIASGWEPQFHTLGFLLCLTATATRSLKTVLQALLLSDPAERMGSISLMYYMSPIALAALLPMVALFEDAPLIRAQELWHADPWFAWAFSANVLLSYAINLTNFLVTHHTSALTIQVVFQTVLGKQQNHQHAFVCICSHLVYVCMRGCHAVRPGAGQRQGCGGSRRVGAGVSQPSEFDGHAWLRCVRRRLLCLLRGVVGCVPLCTYTHTFTQSKRRAAVGATLKKTQDTLAKLADVEHGGWATGKAELGKAQHRAAVSVHAHPGT